MQRIIKKSTLVFMVLALFLPAVFIACDSDNDGSSSTSSTYYCVYYENASKQCVNLSASITDEDAKASCESINGALGRGTCPVEIPLKSQ